MDGALVNHIFFVSLLMFGITGIFYIVDQSIAINLEVITILLLQFSAFLAIYTLYSKTRFKWAVYLLVASALVFVGTFIDRMLDLNSTSFENISDLFWTVAYILFIYAFFTFARTIFLNDTKCICVESILVSGFFMLFSYYILTINGLFANHAVYYIYTFLSIILFTLAFYVHRGSKYGLLQNHILNNTVGLFAAAALVLAIYSMLDGYLKINGLFFENRWVYSLYMLFYVLLTQAFIRMQEMI